MPRPTPIAFFELDVRWIARRGGLRLGAELTVVEHVNGRPRGIVTVRSLDSETLQVGSQVVDLVRTAQHLGGRRPWFSCPACGARVAILYGAPFACRTCNRIAYRSQREPLRDRRLRQAQRIRERLGGSANMTIPFPERPKGMHRGTYDRAWARYLQVERSSIALTAGHLGLTHRE